MRKSNAFMLAKKRFHQERHHPAMGAAHGLEKGRENRRSGIYAGKDNARQDRAMHQPGEYL